LSYEAFSRKYRPKDFEQVIGQEAVVKTLKNAIEMDRISHAYIFAGPRGVGKTTISRILTKCLNCEKGISPEPCNKCENCLEIDKGSFPDMYEIDAASNRGIDDIRNLKDNVGYSPIKGRYKVYIIDEAHMLTREAFNALLKTLEEPPPKNIFILATTELHKIPDTIKSRCQTFIFKPPNVSQIKDYLEKILKKENVEYEEHALELLAKESEGGVRDSASLLDQAVTFGNGKITEKVVEELLGILPQKIIQDFIKNVKERNIKELLKTINDLDKKGYDLNVFWKQITTELYQQLLNLSLGEEKNQIFSEDDIKELIYIQNLFNKGLIEARNFPDPKNIYTLTILKLEYIKDIKPVSELIQYLKTGNVKISETPKNGDSAASKQNEKTKTEFSLQDAILKIGKEAGGIVSSTLKKIKIEEKEDKFIFEVDETFLPLLEEKKEIIQKYFPKKVEFKQSKKEIKRKSKKRDEAVDKMLELFQGKILNYKEE
jgi:DNA polymerase-3 subunit gamma/tau